MTTTKASEIRTADQLRVCDGHPADGVWTYKRIEGLWYFEGDTREEGLTDGDMVRCNDVLKAWRGAEILIDREWTAEEE